MRLRHFSWRMNIDVVQRVIMVFRSRSKKKYTLPKFPPEVSQIFRDLAVGVQQGEIVELERGVSERLAAAKEAAKDHPTVNVPRCEDIAERCRLLLSMLPTTPADKQPLIGGAVRYFLYDADPQSDTVFATGFDDDAQVVNYVLEELGVEGKFISLK